MMPVYLNFNTEYTTGIVIHDDRLPIPKLAWGYGKLLELMLPAYKYRSWRWEHRKLLG